MKTNEIDNTQTSERSANKDRQSDSKAVFFCVPGRTKRRNRNRTAGDGMGVQVCSVQNGHKQEGESVSENLH